MEYNPIAPLLRQAEADLKESHRFLTPLKKFADWYRKTDPVHLKDTISKLKKETLQHTAKIDAAEVALQTAKALLPQAISHKRVALNPFKWIGSRKNPLEIVVDVAANVLHVREIKKTIALHTREILEHRQALNKLAPLLKTKEENYETYMRTSITTCESLIKDREAEELSLRNEHSKWLKQKEAVDKALEPITTEIKKLNTEIDRAESLIVEAEKFQVRLDATSDRYQRKLIHEECELLTDYGRPNDVIHHQKCVIDYAKRNIPKLEARAVIVGKRAAGFIKTLIFDGNNMCRDGTKFVGLRPLVAIANHLAKDYKLIIVFDPEFPRMVNMGSERIAEQFPEGTRIHVVPNRKRADETIVKRASDEGSYIVSNDRFFEFGKSAAIVKQRVIPHEILEGVVLIHDLDLNIKFSHPSLPSEKREMVSSHS